MMVTELVKTTRLKTRLETKKPEPTSAPRATERPVSSAPLAAMELKTSGAPLARARKVTPARFSLMPRMLAILAREGAR